MASYLYLDGRGGATSVAVANLQTDEEGKLIYPPIEALHDVSLESFVSQTILVPAQPICNEVLVAETMMVNGARALVPDESNGRAALRQALSTHNSFLHLMVSPRLTIKGLSLTLVLPLLGALQKAKTPFHLLAWSSNDTKEIHMTLADMDPLVFGDFMSLLAYRLLEAVNRSTQPPDSYELHYRLALSTRQTREGEFGMEGEEWIECFFGDKTATTPFAALKGAGSAWCHCHGPFLTPDSLYLVLSKEVDALGKTYKEVVEPEVRHVDEEPEVRHVDAEPEVRHVDEEPEVKD